MIKFNTIGQIEKGYYFEDAVVDTEVLNGAFGAVTNGKFSAAASATKAVMQVEVGDDMGMDKYKIPAGSHVRVVDLAALNGKVVEVYGAQLPATYKVGDALVSDANGNLVVKEPTVSGSTTTPVAAPKYEITKIIGNKLGVEVKIVAE